MAPTGQAFGVLVAMMGGMVFLTPVPCLAQAIAPAHDSIGTQVRQEGDRFDIDGGQLSQDGANLFHSFERFGLSRGEIANFLSHPNIQNILGRVTGGDASRIDGLIRVSGGSSNLYLMNPAGILFGANARLDVPASFTATTATGIGFGTGWFNVSGMEDYSSLVGNPESFGFALLNPGILVNEGELAVQPGQALSLVGGTVINTGSLVANGGTLTVAAVPGASRVRLSQAGSLLSLEIDPLEAQSGLEGMAIASLPELLTGGNIQTASQITLHADGTVRLGRSPERIAPASATALIAGTLDVRSDEGVGGEVLVVGDRLALIDAMVDASGLTGGGAIRVGGNARGGGSLPTASEIFVNADSSLQANALMTGNGGSIIVWSEENTVFAGDLQAQGGSQAGNGGFAEVSGRNGLTFQGQANLNAERGDRGTLLLDPRHIRIVNGSGGPNDGQVGDSIVLSGDRPNATFTLSEQALETLSGNADLILEASDTITLEDLADNELTLAPGTGSVQFIAGGSFSMRWDDAIRTQGRDLSIRAGSIQAGILNAFQGASENYFTFNGVVLSDDARFPRASGDVTLRARDGIQVTRIYGEDITLVSRFGNIATGSISSEADTAIAPSAILPNGLVRLTNGAIADPATLPNLDNVFNQGEGSHVRLIARSGTIQLRGVLRAGNTNKLSDSTITIEAERFRATNPLRIWENDDTGAQVNPALGPQVPINIYVYGRNTDPPGRNGPVGLGQQGSVLVGTDRETGQPLGEGAALVQIRILNDASFSIGEDFAFGSSGITGLMGIGGRRDPSVNPILQDNFRFTPILLPPPPGPPEPSTPPLGTIDNVRFVETLDYTTESEENLVEATGLVTCETEQASNLSDREEQPILNASAVVPPGQTAQTRGDRAISLSTLCVE